MAVEVYVYYRAAAHRAEALRLRVRQAQAELERRHPGLQARLLRRPQVSEAGEHTWMEAYALRPVDTAPLARVTAELDEPLRADIEATMAAALSGGWLQGPRHIEVFEAF